VDRSGLGRHFNHAAIVKEKDAPAYRKLVKERAMDPALVWMIGNSPKSDVNPALQAGLNAVFIPHAHTWVLEKEEIRAVARELIIMDIGDQTHFLLDQTQWDLFVKALDEPPQIRKPGIAASPSSGWQGPMGCALS
jgi:hypothetical protein